MQIYDLHTHSKYSADGQTTVKRMVARAKKIGLSGFALTDHNSIKGHSWLRKYQKGTDLLLIPGVEISSEDGHILAYGVSKLVKRGLSVAETIEKIEEQGGLPVASHPYRTVTGLGEKIVLMGNFKVVEVFNARTRERNNEKALKLANQLNASQTGGSDGHSPEELGCGFTEVPDGIETVEELIEAIRKGESIGGGIAPSLRKVFGKATSNILKWVKRGLKRM